MHVNKFWMTINNFVFIFLPGKMNRKERTNQSSKKMCIKKKMRNSKFNKMFPKKLKMKQIRKFCKKHARKKMAIQNIN